MANHHVRTVWEAAHRGRMSVKVYVADPTMIVVPRVLGVSAGNDDRFLMKRTAHSIPLGKRKLGNGPRVGRVMVMVAW